ncbi:MAG: hypothetical protein K2X86_11035 [Cytophagaceae bacterium]|nr:hypothetical protein [Cytophagaceae bacterium]
MRILVLFLMIVIAAVAGGIYGAIYDQITYSISSEFFTKFRFITFNIDPSAERLGAARVGFLNTWKTGLVIGGVLALTGLINKEIRMMVNNTAKAFLLVLIVAFVVGLIGWSVGPLPGQADPDAALNITDKDAFKTVVNMNNFSYAGGVIGMFLGIFYQLYKHKLYKAKQAEL